jgi:hypothetical protein
MVYRGREGKLDEFINSSKVGANLSFLDNMYFSSGQTIAIFGSKGLIPNSKLGWYLELRR